MFWHNEEYATGLADIVLDGVVCVVDAVFGKKVSTYFVPGLQPSESNSKCKRIMPTIN